MSINVAVTGLHAADNPAPGIGVIRSLRHPEGWDGKIIGLAYDVLDTGVYDDGLLDHVYMIPYPNQGSKYILERVLYINAEVGIDVLIPTLDSELTTFQQLEPELNQHGIFLFIPESKITNKISKVYLAEFCEKENISYPKTRVIKDPGELKEAVEDIGFPLMLKGVFYEAYTCNNHMEVLNHFDRIKLKWGLPIILQEKLDAEEFDICCVGDDDGNLMGAVPIRKTRLTDKGKAWAAVTLRNSDLMEISKKVLKKLKWKGPCEVEILQDTKTKEYNLIEINPRFPAWIFLCTGADQNLPRMVVDLAMGKTVEPLEPAKSGVCFVRHATDLVCPLEYIEKLTTIGELHYSTTKN
ncbi:MAG: biotin carboxylase [Candidatus Marinimicrobia bacterium]|jgi:carbamoyl-phosphate synthase large subunit|nr:biotin carboxylase [Candidatus Neomarinimicrobiota bacterium]MBT3633264.1 biotin carboxylase [Candidatus Neomarinimicrobiota bacterium]MBT3682135.1 biotin carboxylase [Candidatus Neomarinimicrobiota bacterium]MBT3758864.1 biotin carboxylase [Candidatus Neomarinimicrobiota bacterium]MBT3895261.1 biotin carboxylase [Candidatus Neomarinimicrobiota bacterium]